MGIEPSVQLIMGEGEGSDVIRCLPDPEHEEQLTREDVTASVHSLGFALAAAQIERFAREPVGLAIDHPSYADGTRLPDETTLALLEDLRD